MLIARRLRVFPGSIVLPGEDCHDISDRFLVIGALRACGSSKDLDAARHIHFREIDLLLGDILASNTLMSVYLRCGSMDDARSVFQAMAIRNVVSWNTLIAGFADSGRGDLALECFWRMVDSSGFEPDARSVLAAIKACSVMAEIEKDEEVSPEILDFARTIHAQARARRYDCEDVFVASALVDFYAKCGAIHQARQVFDGILDPNVVSWTALINGYVHSGDSDLALECFRRMLLSGCQADSRALLAALMACSNLAAGGRTGDMGSRTGSKNRNKCEGKTIDQEERSLKENCLQAGVAIHSLVKERHCDSDPFVASALMDMYTNCGSLVDAKTVFDEMPSHGVVAWTALLMGYAENGCGDIALQLFARMISEGCEPNPRTYVAALVACGNLVALQTGKQLVHALICKAGLENETYVGNSLVNFYGTCGSMGDAEQVFGSLKNKTVFTWSGMIEGYSHQGKTSPVFATFRNMKEEGMEPNAVTFVSVLTACSHAGLVDKGREIFHEMIVQHKIQPRLEHYNCLVDNLGRANLLDEAVATVESMPFEANEITWTIVLAACRKWKNVRLGEQAFGKLVKMDRKHETASLLMADLYCSTGMREQLSQILRLLQENI